MQVLLYQMCLSDSFIKKYIKEISDPGHLGKEFYYNELMREIKEIWRALECYELPLLAWELSNIVREQSLLAGSLEFERSILFGHVEVLHWWKELKCQRAEIHRFFRSNCIVRFLQLNNLCYKCSKQVDRCCWMELTIIENEAIRRKTGFQLQNFQMFISRSSSLWHGVLKYIKHNLNSFGKLASFTLTAGTQRCTKQ